MPGYKHHEYQAAYATTTGARRWRLWLCLALLGWLGTALAGNGDVHTLKLANGMQVIVKEDHRAPIVVSQVWYRVGASDENDGITGISHALEHMMFKGTHAHPGGTFTSTIDRLGGQENAFTSRDYTAYYEVLDHRHLKTALALEADRMHNLTLGKSDFEREIRVVREERRMRVEDDPESLTFERFMAAAFVNSPYHHPVIGWMPDLQSLTIDDLRRWYRRWYVPDNAILVVAGDVEPQQVFKLARQAFGPLKAHPLPVDKPRTEVPQRGERRITVEAPAKLPYVLIGYKVPGIPTATESWEPYALQVLGGILSGGDSARLPRILIRGREVAAGASAGYNPYARYETLFMLDGTPAEGRSIHDVEQALLKQVGDLRNKPVAADELARVKAGLIAQEVYARDSLSHQATQLGMLAALGLDWHLAETYTAHIKAVTAAQVQAVARKYLVAAGRTIAELKPLPIDPNRPPRSGGASSGPIR
ncbi:MAG: pitrilysin family protein [Gammaproteobacteria bacterium]